MPDVPRIRQRSPAYPPISKEGHAGLKRYVKAALKHAADPDSPAPETEWLRQGIPQGSIQAITPDLGVQVKHTGEEGALRSPRVLDAPGIALIRALTLAGGSIGLNRKRMHHPDRRDYLHYRAMFNGQSLKVPMARIIADTQAGYQTPGGDDHRSYRRKDLPAGTEYLSSQQLTLERTPTKSPYRGREFALKMAMHCFDANRDKLDFEITRAEYASLLRDILSLLDKLPLKGMQP